MITKYAAFLSGFDYGYTGLSDYLTAFLEDFDFFAEEEEPFDSFIAGRQYGQRLRKEIACRITPGSGEVEDGVFGAGRQ